MDPYTLGYLAGHSDFSTTKRYIHPQAQTVLAAMERARVAQSRALHRKRGQMSSLADKTKAKEDVLDELGSGVRVGEL
jgi:hypothetical protein